MTMFKITVVLQMAAGEWIQETGDWDSLIDAQDLKYADGYLQFIHKLELPFPPSIGLKLSGKGWSAGPLTSVTYDLKIQEFYCSVQTDDEVPDKLEAEILKHSDVGRELKEKRSFYLSQGWEDINLEFAERMISKRSADEFGDTFD